MRLTWSTIFKILLCIALCAICIIIYNWFIAKPKEGFQTTNGPITLTEKAKYGGINSPIVSGGSAVTQIPNNSQTTNCILFVLNSPLVSYQKRLPVKIIATGVEVSGYIFNYNYPQLIIHADSGNPWTATTTGVRWSATGNIMPTETTEYTIQTNFCDINFNKPKLACYQQIPETERFLPETEVETEIYDTYEAYNIDPQPNPVATQAVEYSMAQELTEFDSGAPIPWDYDNRTLNPKEVLWGNIHPNVSQSIFSTAYARDVLQSINNLEYNTDTGWSYTSVMFERSWSGDDKKFLPGIQFAEFLAQTGIALAVPYLQEKVVEKLLNATKWGSEADNVFDNTKKARQLERKLHSAMINNGVSPKEAKAFSQAYKNAHFNNLQMMNNFSAAEKAACVAKFDEIMDAGGLDAGGKNVNRLNASKIIDASEAQFREIDRIYKSKLSDAVGEAAAAADAAKAAGAADATGDAARAAKLAASGNVTGKTVSQIADVAQDVDKRLFSIGVESKTITSGVVKTLGKEGAAELAQKGSGKLASKFAKAIGMTMGGKGLLYAIATVICGGPSCAPIVAAINVFIDIFCISCMTWIPAILEHYVPSDAVCPEGSFNIRDAMVALPGGAVGWEIVSNIPGLGDGLGTFGPYLCSKMVTDSLGTKSLGEVVLKKPRISPGYFYDSALSLYCDTNKTAMSPEEPQFSDRRMYTRNRLTGDATTKYPFWQNSGVAPIWVDFSDSRMLNKMAQFYYSFARRLAIDNGDGTYTFEYISKFYGVIVSSEFSCDVQCEITTVTYYAETGDIQTKYAVPLPPDSGSGTTYHDRRFYFYAIQVSDNPALNTEDQKSARNVENYYYDNNKLLPNTKFLNYDLRNQCVATRNDFVLDALMTDNVNRFVVTACTNTNGTAPNTQEVNGEGNYVGDAIVSLGNNNMEYYPPEISMNTSYLAAISNAITDPIDFNTGTTQSTVFTYSNPLIGFVVGDSVEAIAIDPTSTTNIREETLNGRINRTLNPSVPLNKTSFFTAIVASYTTQSGQTSTKQKLTFSNIVPTNLQTKTYVFIIRVTARSSTTLLGTNDSGCAAIRSSVYRHGRSPIPTSSTPQSPLPSYSATTTSTTSIPWSSGAFAANNPANQSVFSTKVWKESLMGEVISKQAMGFSVLQSSVMGFVGFRVSYRGAPTGALLTGGVLSTNFNPEWSISSLLACSYQDLMRNTGTYVLNGNIVEIEIGTDNKYLYIERGPIIPFAPGYTPTIDYRIVDLQQTDCVNRTAIRKAVNAFNNNSTLNKNTVQSGSSQLQVSKVLRIETDTKNKKCLYVFETEGFNPETNIRDSSITNTILAVVPYYYSNPSASSNPIVMPHLALIPRGSDMKTAKYTLGSIDKALEFETSIHSTDFSSTEPALLSGYAPPVRINLNKDNVNDGGIFTSIDDIRNIARKGNTLGTNIYTCDYEPLKKRLMTQFNLQTNGNPRITSFIATYYPKSGSKQRDGTVQCIYDANVQTDNSNTTNKQITMTLTKAVEPTNSLYDMVYNDYPASYVYQPVPKPGNWITIPAPLPKATNIFRTGCLSNADMSTCANIHIMKNLVNAFNTKVTDGKIMKVRKAYTAFSTATINVCDYEVEMLRTINETSTLIQKETIRLPIVPSADPEKCMWDLNYPATTVPIPDTGLSLTNNYSISKLEEPYVWGESFIKDVKDRINNAIKDYLALGTKEILSNTSMSINYEAKKLYNTLLTSLSLDTTVPGCQKTCRNTEVTQAIINRYYKDNYPYQQYGAVKREMVEVRRVGTFNSNTCQVEFIEKVQSYANFISSPIFTENPLSPDAQFNTRYYLRQYEFKTIPDPNICEFNIKSISEVVSTNSFFKIDLSGNADAIMSDASALSANEITALRYTGHEINCYHGEILRAVEQKYNMSYQLNVHGRPPQYNTLTRISTAFNPRPHICEYTARIRKPLKSMSGSIYLVNDVPITLRAQWGSYFEFSKDMVYTAGSSQLIPDFVEQFDLSQIKTKIQSDNSYKSYNSDGIEITLPYTYGLPSNFDSNRVSTASIIFPYNLP